jgi:hypothetical protein
VDLDAAADELYGSSPDEFIARRTALVGDARKAGDRTLANEIGQLRKPTRTAWLVNLLARSDANRIDELLDLGRQLQEAQRSSSATDLRRLSARRRTTVDALTREAVELGKAAGYAASEGAVQEMGQTLQAALADPEVAEQLRRGRLVQAASYGGFGPVVTPPTGEGRGAEAGSTRSPDLLAALAASVETRGKRTTPSPAAQDRAGQQARQELAEAKDGWEAAGRAADEAAADAERATARAEDLAAEIEKIRGRLREAESAERDARTEARAARKRAMQLRQSAAAAEQRVSTARTTLKTLEG